MTRRELGGLLAAAALRADEAKPYAERLRPQFHFTPLKGWTNDPNGLVYYRGEYHLFFQHNPFGTKWGNMTWGHAVSKDLVHWRQLPSAIEPYDGGTIFSGSAVVDEENTAGLATGSEKTLVALYTFAGKPFTQCMAYSNDAGQTWTKYAANPVVPNIIGENRDPKVIWHAPTRRWIMALFLDGNTYRLLASPDLKKWTTLHDLTIPGASECPDFFELPVSGEPGVTRWVFTAANNHYLIGTFDGARFVPEVMTQPGHYGRNYYAVQTYSGLPLDRRIQIAWMNGGQYPDMPFNQQMSFPYRLELRRAGLGMKLYSNPIPEIDLLHHQPHAIPAGEVKAGDDPLSALTGDLWDITADIEPAGATEFGFVIAGRAVTYRVKEKQLTNGPAVAPLAIPQGRLRLRLLIDRTSVELFGNDGEVTLPCCFLPEAGKPSLSFFTRGGPVRLHALNAWSLKAAW